MLNRILKKFKFVKELEIKISQLEAVNHTLMIQKSEAVVEKKRAALKVKYLESAVVDMIENPHVFFVDANGKFISIAEADLEKNKHKHVTCVHSLPANRIEIRVRE